MWQFLLIYSALLNVLKLPKIISVKCSREVGNESPAIKIVGGSEAEKNELPYQIGLVDTKDEKLFCGGVLLNSSYVLTAAHCVENAPAEQISVIGGAHNIKKAVDGKEPRAQSRGVAQIIVNPTYEVLNGGSSGKDDLAILRLTEKFKLNAYIQPIRLATPETSLASSALISGWGCTKHSLSGCRKAGVSAVLKKANVTIWSDEDCRKSYSTLPLPLDIFDSHICVGNQGVGTCLGDSGGPVVIFENETRILVGITSFGADLGCACDGVPSVFTEVSYFHNWTSQALLGKFDKDSSTRNHLFMPLLFGYSVCLIISNSIFY